MANIMSMTQLRNKPSRNGFDLSRKNMFTAKVGEMLPAGVLEMIPGDSFDIDLAWFTRTQAVNTAAYTRIREYYDFYFVPTNLLWNKFNTFVTQMSDNNQKATGINGNVKLSDEHPYFTYEQVAQYIQDQYAEDKKNFFGLSRAELSCKLLHYLDYGDFTPYLRPESSTPITTFTNAKLNPFPLLAYQKIYQDFIRDSQWEKAYAPACNIDYMTGASGTNNLPVSEIDRDNENMFDLRYFNWNKDYFMGLLPSAQYGDVASIEFGGDNTIQGPFDWLMKGALDMTGGYQNYVDMQVNGNTNRDNYITGINGSNQRVEVAARLTNSDLSRLKSSLGIGIEQFTILALRNAEAKQKWAEITQSEQQDYKSQIQAHFGVNVSDAYSDRCQYIGGVNGTIDIDPVMNQNLADGNEADIAGRGQGGSRGSIKFDCKVHGYLMCIYHSTPLLDFAIDGIKKHNLKTTVFDYAIPEFDQTGMVSVPLVELTTTYNPVAGVEVDKTLLGYAPRYIEYKTSFDQVHGAFFNGGLDAWVAPIDNNYINEYLENLGAAVANGAINYHFFKVPPSVLNPIFAVNADSSVASDQFLINAAFDIKAVRNLDRNGLPY